MRTVWKWLKRAGIAIHVVILGAVGGGGGHLIADRRDMYGDDPANDLYSPEFDPLAKRR